MATINGDALRGHLETLVLSALRQGNAHGFQILRRLEEGGSGALKLKEGSLYPALYRLEAAGLVKGEWEDNATPRRGPRRRIYHLTPKGRRRYQQAREEFHQFAAVIGAILGRSA
jgi:DNA-binding PadR family transcriptional regulator